MYIKNKFFILNLKKRMKIINMEKCQFCCKMFGDTKMLKQHQKKNQILS
jgi:hypothetical protein